MLTPVALLVLNSRCPIADRTYVKSLALELVLLGLWIAPTYAVASSVASVSPAAVPKSSVATLAFCGLNLYVYPHPHITSPPRYPSLMNTSNSTSAFRLLNVLGNAVLLTEPALWRRKKPGLPLPARLAHLAVALLVFWTYPRAVEQHYRPPSKRERKLYEARRK